FSSALPLPSRHTTPPSGQLTALQEQRPPPFHINRPITGLEMGYLSYVISSQRPLFHRLVRFPYGVVSCSPITRNAGKVVTMSGGLDVLQMKEEDVLKFLAAGTHLGGTNLDFQVEQYVYKRKSDGVYIINLKKTWEKLLLAARAIVAIENPADVCVISSRNTGQIQAAFREPRLLIVTDPRADHQPLTEASYVNIPTIALLQHRLPAGIRGHRHPL
ncbi:hypothetical protein FQN60_004312, partial [Etheostoma spectabile]